MEMVVEGRNQSGIALKQIKLEEAVDRISGLKDCLLVEILTRLPSTKDAIRTGILSKRWGRLWTSVHTLSFTYTESYDSLNPSATNPNALSDFVSLVDKTLTQCRGSKLKKFVLYTRYDNTRFESQVNNWIHYAIGREVAELDLSFPRMGMGDRFMLDQKFFTGSCFTYLKLSGCIFHPTGAISWKNLKRLCISSDIIDEDFIENVLSGSPVLEMLGLIYCSGYKRLDITSKSVKCLVFISYVEPGAYFDGNSIIEINAPNILSLSIQGTLLLRKLLLVNVSSLVEANLDYEKCGRYATTHEEEEAEEEMLKGFILKLRMSSSC